MAQTIVNTGFVRILGKIRLPLFWRKFGKMVGFFASLMPSEKQNKHYFESIYRMSVGAFCIMGG